MLREMRQGLRSCVEVSDRVFKHNIKTNNKTNIKTNIMTNNKTNINLQNRNMEFARNGG